jgi:hypothetical protein
MPVRQPTHFSGNTNFRHVHATNVPYISEVDIQPVNAIFHMLLYFIIARFLSN